MSRGKAPCLNKKTTCGAPFTSVRLGYVVTEVKEGSKMAPRNVSTRTAGHKLQALRKARTLTQDDIVRLSHGKLSPAQVSRLENGNLTKPPMKDLVEYGVIVGLSPNEVAALYGYYDAPSAERKVGEDETLARLRGVAERLTPGQRDKLYEWVDFAVAKAVADERAG